jgi:type III pantothenate kinase
MMNLVIDIGNSRTKFSIFNPSGLMMTATDTHFGPESVKLLCEEFPALSRVILSSTKDYGADLQEFLFSRFTLFIELNENTPIPLINRYKTPETLGKDRLAGAVGASGLFPETNLLIIDAGTALTFDIVTEEGVYLGGNISPGLEMRFKSLHHFTGRLPLVGDKLSFPIWGDTTETAIRAGVQNGILFEVEAYIDHFKKFYKKNQVILTGGDLKFFETKVKNSFFVHSNLVSTGLNRILEYNAENL